MADIPFEFDSEIQRLEGKIQWSVLYFPHATMEYFGSKGNIPVCITVDGHAFDHMLLPSKKGHYLVYNAFIKQAVGKEIGDSVHVTLVKDTKKRELVIPAYIEAALREADLLEAFHEQPAYYQREMINTIEVAKKEETKKNRLQAMITRLGKE